MTYKDIPEGSWAEILGLSQKRVEFICNKIADAFQYQLETQPDELPDFNLAMSFIADELKTPEEGFLVGTLIMDAINKQIEAINSEVFLMTENVN